MKSKAAVLTGSRVLSIGKIWGRGWGLVGWSSLADLAHGVHRPTVPRAKIWGKLDRGYGGVLTTDLVELEAGCVPTTLSLSLLPGGTDCNAASLITRSRISK